MGRRSACEITSSLCMYDMHSIYGRDRQRFKSFFRGYRDGPLEGPDGTEFSWRDRMKTRKDVTKSFLQLAATGRAQDAFEQHVGPGFRHHNPYFASGAKALMDGMNENARENPDKHLEVLRAIEEGDLVATYSFVRHKRDDPGAVGRAHLSLRGRSRRGAVGCRSRAARRTRERRRGTLIRSAVLRGSHGSRFSRDADHADLKVTLIETRAAWKHGSGPLLLRRRRSLTR